MICENDNCEVEHNGSFGSGRFCSRACANSRVRTKEIKNKISKSVKLAIAENRLSPPTKPEYGPEYFEKILADRKEKRKEELLAADYSSLKFERFRERIIIEQDNKCNNCGLKEWLGESLVLELEHKDGNRHNNDRENVEMLCPNCHSLTETWRGRNKEGVIRPKNHISEEDMVKAFLQTGNIRQCLLKLGLAPKGNNYGRVKRVLTLWNIDY